MAENYMIAAESPEMNTLVSEIQYKEMTARKNLVPKADRAYEQWSKVIRRIITRYKGIPDF
jgi:hypothetical protein